MGGFNLCMHYLQEMKSRKQLRVRLMPPWWFCIGEGAGALVSWRIRTCKSAWCKIYCEVGGGGMSWCLSYNRPHPKELSYCRNAKTHCVMQGNDTRSNRSHQYTMELNPLACCRIKSN
jgi:3-oxoacyl-[acyl-carrier-protein] synthase II